MNIIKSWFAKKEKQPENAYRWSCPKHGSGGPSIAFYRKDGKRIAACILCICEAFPLNEVEE